MRSVVSVSIDERKELSRFVRKIDIQDRLNERGQSVEVRNLSGLIGSKKRGRVERKGTVSRRVVHNVVTVTSSGA